MSNRQSGPPASKGAKAKPPSEAADQRAALARAIEALCNAAGGVPAAMDKIVPSLQAMIVQSGGLPPVWEESLRKTTPITKRLRPSPAWPPKWQEIYSALAQPVGMMTCFKVAIATTVDPDASQFHPDSLLLTVDKLLTWEPICRDAAAKLRDKLDRLRDSAPKTWLAGDAIRVSMLGAFADLSAIVAHPPRGLSAKRSLQRAAAVRAGLPSVMGFDGAPLLDDLARAVGADFAADAAAHKRAATGDFTIVRLREMTGLENDALNKYGKLAGVQTPGRGKRNHTYTREQTMLILQKIVETCSTNSTRDRCWEALESLKNPNEI
jgi:hypothetical protein